MSEHQPLISVSLPVYNGENFIAAAIECVLNQTVTDLELIITDNTSTDRTEEICKAYVEKDSRVRYIRQEKNLGVTLNFNRGYHEATGKYFKWITHDDLITPDCLEKSIAMLEANPGSVLAHSRIHLIDENDQTIEYYDTGLEKIGDPRQSVRFGEMILKPHQCLECDGVMPREAVGKTALYGSFPGADRALITEIVLVGPFIRTEEPLFITREHQTRFRRAQVTPQDRLATYDTSMRGKKMVGTWVMYRDYWRMVNAQVTDKRERRACKLHLLKWWLVNWNTARVVVDVISLFFPGFLIKAEVFKQRVFSPEPGPNAKAREQQEGV